MILPRFSETILEDDSSPPAVLHHICPYVILYSPSTTICVAAAEPDSILLHNNPHLCILVYS